MAFQTVFQRYEAKYLLDFDQKQRVLEAMEPYMEPDCYGRAVLRNLYFDTESYQLIRRSMEKPVYKEKLRVRSYCQAQKDSTVFVELKKKYEKVVYKRRLALQEGEAMAWLCRREPRFASTQISREIDYVLDCYGKLSPKVFLSYCREAYYEKNGGSFRVTFDESILCRREELSLCSPVYGTPLLPEGKVLMELKCEGGLPLWMVRVLSRERIYKTSFSKYATGYTRLILGEEHEKREKGVCV